MNTLSKLVSRLKNTDRSGFTLIELVVVVVIIGILTAIAIPSYGAIQQTARNNTDAVTIKSYIKGVNLINIQDGKLPDRNACLGPSSLYPNDDASNCQIGGQFASKADSASFNEKLHKVGVADAVLQSDVSKSIVYAYGYYGNDYTVLFSLYGNDRDCRSFGPVLSDNGSGRWSFYGAKNSFGFAGDNTTYCAIGIK